MILYVDALCINKNRCRKLAEDPDQDAKTASIIRIRSRNSGSLLLEYRRGSNSIFSQTP